MQRFALGILHFNIFYTIGNVPSYHRQVRESIIPVLDLLSRHSDWCFTIEMSGISIEFLAKNYPSVLDRIRSLILSKQIELISSTYSPQIWISFPLYDLVKSIELNIRLLKNYNLKTSKIFFSQENFCGEGIKAISKYFEYALIKDDYYFYLHAEHTSEIFISPFYHLGKMKVMVGWGHILEMVITDLSIDEEESDELQFLKDNVKAVHCDFLKSVEQKYNYGTKPEFTGKFKDFEWTWFHYGSAERFSKPHIRPENINTCQVDRNWSLYIEKLLEKKEKSGFRFSSIQDFFSRVANLHYQASPLLPLLDGSWNMENSRGGFIWMGLNNELSENDVLVRNINWKSRNMLLACEFLFHEFYKKNAAPLELAEKIKDAWSHQLLAEVSDATGWYPHQCEINFSIGKSEKVLNIVADVASSIKLVSDETICKVDVNNKKIYYGVLDKIHQEHQIKKNELFLSNFELLGAEGIFYCYQSNSSLQKIIFKITPTGENICGVKFPWASDIFSYSPALMEDELVTYSVKEFSPDIIYLPLTNGIIGVGGETFIIKHNECMSMAACLNYNDSFVGFLIENPVNCEMWWTITLFKGSASAALDVANSINVFPTITI